jgi:hypothetical protein
MRQQRWTLGADAPVLARALAAPMVLLVVLASHVSLRSSADLTPWKGGGFGMFSTIDSPASRIVRIELDTDVGPVPVAVPSALRDLAGEVRTAPSQGRLEHLARAMAAQWWVVPVLSVPDVSSSPEDEPLRDLAVRALSHVLPSSTVRTIDPARFDGSRQQRLAVEAVHVSVLRLASEGGHGALRPRAIRSVTVDVAPAPGSETP